MRSARLSLVFFAALCSAIAVPAAASAGVHVKSLSTFGEFGTGAGQLREAGGGVYAGDGDFYVVDKGNDRVDVFGPNGKFKFTFGKGVNGEDQSDVCKAGEECVPGLSGPKAGYLQRPEALALTEGKVFVTDPGNDRVSVFSEAGEFLFVFGKDVGEGGEDTCDKDPCRAGKPGGGTAQMADPTGIVGLDSQVFIADTTNNRIDVYHANGSFVVAYGYGVNGRGFYEFCDSDYACRPGLGGAQAGMLAGPTSLTYNRHNGSLYVASPTNNRIDVVAGDSNLYRWSFGAGVGGEEVGTCDMQTGCEKGASNFEAGSLPDPTGVVSFLINEEIYVADGQANRVSKFDAKGNFIRAWGKGVKDGSAKLQICAATCRKGGQGTEAGAINAPTSLTIGPSGSLALTETRGKLGSDLSRVQVLQETPGAESPKPGRRTPSSLLLSPF
ncbi:MAG: NHL repeat-containing protein [Solirubrobacterales bacterium]